MRPTLRLLSQPSSPSSDKDSKRKRSTFSTNLKLVLLNYTSQTGGVDEIKKKSEIHRHATSGIDKRVENTRNGRAVRFRQIHKLTYKKLMMMYSSWQLMIS